MGQINHDLDKYANLKVTFADFAENRHVSTWTQFTAIFGRNWQYLCRNPRSLTGIMFNGLFTGLLCLALFMHVGRYKYDIFQDPGEYIAWIYNLNGFGFLLANNISFSSSSSVIL